MNATKGTKPGRLTWATVRNQHNSVMKEWVTSPWITDWHISKKNNQGTNVNKSMSHIAQFMHRCLSQYVPALICCASLDLQLLDRQWTQCWLNSLCPTFCRQLCRVTSWRRLLHPSPSIGISGAENANPGESYALNLVGRWNLKPGNALLKYGSVQWAFLTGKSIDNRQHLKGKTRGSFFCWLEAEEAGQALISLCNFVHSKNILSCW